MTTERVGGMVSCPRCNKVVDPESPDVIELRHYVLVQGALEVEGEKVLMETAFFHKSCARRMGPDWEPE